MEIVCPEEAEAAEAEEDDDDDDDDADDAPTIAGLEGVTRETVGDVPGTDEEGGGIGGGGMSCINEGTGADTGADGGVDRERIEEEEGGGSPGCRGENERICGEDICEDCCCCVCG